MTIEVLPQEFTVCKVQSLGREQLELPFCFVGKTDWELSLVCPTENVPNDTVVREDGWRGFRIAGTLEFSLVGILSKLSGILAAEKIGIFAVSTYDTDYILLKCDELPRAVRALEWQGYEIKFLKADL